MLIISNFQKTWFGVLHHVCGEHVWAGGACKHSPDETGTSGKTYLAKSSKAVTALREVVLDKKWLNNLEFYVRFRSVIFIVGNGVINLKTVDFLALVKMHSPPPPPSLKQPDTANECYMYTFHT